MNDYKEIRPDGEPTSEPIGFAVVEETEINTERSEAALKRMKDWIESDTVRVPDSGLMPHQHRVGLHFIQCSGDRDFMPTFPAGDLK